MADVNRDLRAYTVREASKRMGIGIWLLYEMLAQGEIPHFRFRKSIRIDSSDLEQWLAAHRVVGPTRQATKDAADAPTKRGMAAVRSRRTRASAR